MSHTQYPLFQNGREHGTVQRQLNLSTLREFTPEARTSILKQVKQIEKRTFPANEAMDLTTELASRSNTAMLVLFSEHATVPAVVAYALYLRWQRRILLHKICVHSDSRNQGHGSLLMSNIVAQARKASCSAIDLWVDEARTAAKRLYTKFGFEQVDRVENYYSQGRTGIKMSLILDLDLGL